MTDLDDMRSKMMLYTCAINVFVNLLSIGSQGRVEEYVYRQGTEILQ